MSALELRQQLITDAALDWLHALDKVTVLSKGELVVTSIVGPVGVHHITTAPLYMAVMYCQFEGPLCWVKWVHAQPYNYLCQVSLN